MVWHGIFSELLGATICRYKNYPAFVRICYFMTFGSTLTAGTLHVTLPHVGYERCPGKGRLIGSEYFVEAKDLGTLVE